MRIQSHPKRFSGNHHRAGFTLIEMILAAAIISIVMLATQSAIILAARSIPDSKNASGSVIVASRAGDMIASDLTYATSIITMTATDLKFTVPDRNGDGVAETIEYAWSGVAGAPLTRTYNGATAVNIAGGVQEFALTYDKKTVVATQTYTESAEVLLCKYDSALLTADSRVQASSWVAQCFRPTLPSNAVTWRPTRVQFKAKSYGTAVGTCYISIRPANTSGTLPSAIVLAQVVMSESMLSSTYQWIEWSGLASTYMALPPGSGAAMVFKWGSDSDACALQYQSLLSSSTDSNMATTSNGGTSWSQPAAQDMNFYAYGKYTTPDPVAYIYELTSVRTAIRVGGDSTTRLTSSIRVPNEPVVAGP